MIAKIKTLSICPCGYPLFMDRVKIGDEYEVHPSITAANSTVVCGGCKKQIKSTFIWANGRGMGRAGWFPSEALDMSPDSITTTQ